MFKTLFTGFCFFVLLANTVFARGENCGDGNQRITEKNYGDTVRYFASINEFDLVRETEDKVVITDSVSCRYGTDALFNIEIIEFLDKTVSTEELVLHETAKDLSVDVLRTILLDALLEQIRSLGVDPDQDKEIILETIQEDNLVEQVKVVSSSKLEYVPEALTSTERAIEKQLSSSFHTNTDISPTNTYTYYDPYSNLYTNSQFSTGQQPTPASVITTWPTSAVAASDIVYFEAIDSNNQHHYLGSSLGYAGSKTLSLPASLLDEPSIEIHVKTNGRLIKSFGVSL